MPAGTSASPSALDAERDLLLRCRKKLQGRLQSLQTEAAQLRARSGSTCALSAAAEDSPSLFWPQAPEQLVWRRTGGAPTWTGGLVDSDDGYGSGIDEGRVLSGKRLQDSSAYEGINSPLGSGDEDEDEGDSLRLRQLVVLERARLGQTRGDQAPKARLESPQPSSLQQRPGDAAQGSQGLDYDQHQLRAQQEQLIAELGGSESPWFSEATPSWAQARAPRER
jgi:hypothetical protein